ncbi:glycosyl transferase family group 2-domain-containing protein [Daldinia bambusicola]|nr:glycosyl transferase family group 2-domain-containing protein [Daldinia bambusicola]
MKFFGRDIASSPVRGERSEDDDGETSDPEHDEAGPSNSKSSIPSSNSSIPLKRRTRLLMQPWDTFSDCSLLITKGTRKAIERANDAKGAIVCSWIYQQQIERQYITGLIPEIQSEPDGLYDMAIKMNVRCIMTVNTRVIAVVLHNSRSPYHIPITRDLYIQVLPTIADLVHCKRHHFAAFIDDMKLLVVWDDSPKQLIERAVEMEKELLRKMWGRAPGDLADHEIETKRIFGRESRIPKVTAAEVDLENLTKEERRKNKLSSASIVSFTLILCMTCMGFGLRALAYEIAVSGSYTRLALVIVIPVEAWVAFFFFQSLVTNLWQIVGEVACIDENSRFYSGIAPVRLNREVDFMPHVTIQMPVYKEGLKAVIKPSIESLKKCISTYEMQGGSANIFINDDGMQLISDSDAQARREYYDENNIGWVARPPHNPNPTDDSRPFLRRGKFKKASNMNFGLMVSNRVEDKLLQVHRPPGWTNIDEKAAYSQCLAEVLEEDGKRTLAEGNVRIGDYILIVDSDTRVPEDCLLDAVSEMERSPQVAILQFTSGVMQVSTSYFESGVKWFTNLIYTAITFVVASGDACPFVGHNAVLRWSAIQDAAAYKDEDGYEKYWSESHVSEDFEMSLKLQCAGYELRFAAYTGEGFQEGVSLTVYDELARWEKYAYGCNELLFHPLRYWFTKGPITPLFRQFISSNIHLPKKMTICAYIGTYYAIGACWILTLMNYFLSGWFFGLYDKFYLDSFAIFVSVVVVFTGLGNFSLAIYRYRLNEMELIEALWSNIKWIPLMTIFLGGLSLHVSQALVFHFIGVDMSWGATAKEIEKVDFFEEIPRLFRRFKGTFTWGFFMIALIVCGYFAFPPEWRIVHFASIWPLAWTVACHILLPIVLNPALMVFTF